MCLATARSTRMMGKADGLRLFLGARPVGSHRTNEKADKKPEERGRVRDEGIEEVMVDQAGGERCYYCRGDASEDGIRFRRSEQSRKGVAGEGQEDPQE